MPGTVERASIETTRRGQYHLSVGRPAGPTAGWRAGLISVTESGGAAVEWFTPGGGQAVHRFDFKLTPHHAAITSKRSVGGSSLLIFILSISAVVAIIVDLRHIPARETLQGPSVLRDGRQLGRWPVMERGKSGRFWTGGLPSGYHILWQFRRFLRNRRTAGHG